jgi:hypothetical protein
MKNNIALFLAVIVSFSMLSSINFADSGNFWVQCVSSGCGSSICSGNMAGRCCNSGEHLGSNYFCCVISGSAQWYWGWSCPCTPATCASLGKTCGNWDNGCGVTLECGGCASCKYCSNGNCLNQPDGFNDCSGCQRCISGYCQDYNSVCQGTPSSCYCSSGGCQSCPSSGCCDASCSGFSCGYSTNSANCPSEGWYDTGNIRWVAGPDVCKEYEEKESAYRSYYCSSLNCRCDFNIVSNKWSGTGASRPKAAAGTRCGDCQVCDNYGNCVDNSKPSCGDCQAGPYCDTWTNNWYCNNKASCSSCSGGFCDGSGNCVANPCGTCKYCSSGSCVNRFDTYNDCGSGCQRCISGSCQDYDQACSGITSSCSCSGDSCTSCPSSGCCDATCWGFGCGLSQNNNNCQSGYTCQSDCTCISGCIIGGVCKYDSWFCDGGDGSCRRARDVYVYDSACNCVYDHKEYENAQYGEHCSGGTFTNSGYCASGSQYCSAERYNVIDRYECNGNNACNAYDYTDWTQDCGATSYSCNGGNCARTYHYTCSGGSCGSYSTNQNCPSDTSCSGGSCSINNACSTGGSTCSDICNSGQQQNRCDGSGNCGNFWRWINTNTCNPFSCSSGSCSSTCSSNCGSSAACNGKAINSACGTGMVCDASCNCVVSGCNYPSQASCNADSNCAWCSGGNWCGNKASVECQPGQCSGDSTSKCSQFCTWQDCGSTSGSCFCSSGSCASCSGSSPVCSNYACGCSQDSDCPSCYQKCDTSSNSCYDFRSDVSGSCLYYDDCTSAGCSADPAYCFNADANQCSDSNWRCHSWFTC